MPNFNLIENMEVSTGNVATVRDAFDATKARNGAKNPLGKAFYVEDSSGRILKYRYVQYNPTAAVTLTLNTNVPGIVFWKDNAHTIVTPTMSEGITTKANNVAGYLLNASVLDTEYCFIQVAGYLSNAVVAASTAIDDVMIGLGSTPLIAGRIATGSAITALPIGIALAAISTAQAPVFVTCEPL